MGHELSRRDARQIRLQFCGLKAQRQFDGIRQERINSRVSRRTPFHRVMQLRPAGFYEAKPLIEPCGPVAFEHLQANRLFGGGRLAEKLAQQGGADAGVAKLREQREVHHEQLRGRAIDDDLSGIHAVDQDDLKFCAGIGAAVALLAGAKLHGEKARPQFGRKARGVQFLLACAGVQFEKEGLVLRLFWPDADDFGFGWHGSLGSGFR